LWSILLGVVGLKVVHQTSWARAAIAVVAVLGVLAALGWASSMVPWAW
jgi:hypothetical protein